MFEPRVGRDGGFAAISVVVEKLFVCLDVPGGDQNQMRCTVDAVKLRLTVSHLTVVDQPSHSTAFPGRIHAKRIFLIKTNELK